MNKEELVKEAIKAQANAYAPYSQFKVGAALLTSNGKVYYGANVENASYGMSMCAERSAIFNAISNGVKPSEIEALALVTNTKDFGKPCGACRQVMAEFFTNKVKIYLANNKGDINVTDIDHLLPLSFNNTDLNK